MAKLKPDKQAVTVSVRTVAAYGQRYRAGLGPFGPLPVVVQADPDQVAALQADPMLIVEEIK